MVNKNQRDLLEDYCNNLEKSDGGLGHGGSSGVTGCSSSGYILKVIKMEFANRSHVGCERERTLGLNQKFWSWWDCGKSRLRDNQVLNLDMLGLRCLLDIQVKVLSRHLYIKV